MNEKFLILIKRIVQSSIVNSPWNQLSQNKPFRSVCFKPLNHRQFGKGKNMTGVILFRSTFVSWEFPMPKGQLEWSVRASYHRCQVCKVLSLWK